jgi:hypothetical protein
MHFVGEGGKGSGVYPEGPVEFGALPVLRANVIDLVIVIWVI